MSENHPQKKTWIDLETFTEDGSDLAVRVQASADERPILSWQTGRVRDERFMPHHRNRYNTEGGVVLLEFISFEVLARLGKRAQDFIQSKLQERENAFQESKRGQADQASRKVLGNKPKQRNDGNGHRGGNGKRGRDADWDFNR